VTTPGGETRRLPAALRSPQDGRYVLAARFDQAGVYRLSAVASHDGRRIGTASRPVLVGGTDVEMSQPALNVAVLQRLSAATGGHYVPAERAAEVPALLRASRVEAGTAEMRDLWHNGWSMAALMGLLAAEWVLRRRAGLA
jgi:hypothetical protein